jgi:hypothetical protein
LGEYHYVAATSDKASIKYPSDKGWVLGAKFTTPIKTVVPESFNDISIRYGTGIANGGDNGNTFTWATYGAPNDEGRYTGAYSLTMVEHFLLTPSKKGQYKRIWSIYPK